MHYYQFNIGDYKAATSHLSNEEDLAYRRLLDMYYDSENKIPLDTEWVSRRIRVAASVIRDVLNDMFVKQEDGYFHSRCDDVIKQYQAMAEKNRANGKGGGRPKNNPVGIQSQPIDNPKVTLTINHKPITNKRATEVATPEGVSIEVWEEFLKNRKAKKANVSALVINRISEEARKAGWTLENALKEIVIRNWQSFKADWVKDSKETYSPMKGIL
jgi:uncharacterized protein YdaU (DUF1376 family)